ncbi:MAG: Tad domain-containing protein [Alphaproteobacteria bacterium]|nr:Tad domain-containing protein [Alphaproteobacteria bacterium]
MEHLRPDSSGPGTIGTRSGRSKASYGGPLRRFFGTHFLGSHFFGNSDGGVTIYVTLISVLLLGFGGLVVDLGRLFTLQTELQNAADAAALSGAAELDFSPGSINRARMAAKNGLINNTQTFATGSPVIVITDENIRFLSVLPASDDDPITDSHLTTNDAAAVFIEVTASVREVSYLLAPALALSIGGDGTAPQSGKASAVAVAGFNQAVCNFPPLMICNPAEADGNAGAPFEAHPGEIVLLKSKGGIDAHWGPGNFGLLDPPVGNSGAANVANNIASANPKGCFSNLVELRTGQAENPIANAINVRFDMYQEPHFGGNAKNDSRYRPAPNVTKGKYKSGNAYEDYEGAPVKGMAMPTHDCFGEENCYGTTSPAHSNFAPPLTATEWTAYWDLNHDGLDFNALAFSGSDLNGDLIDTPIDANDDGSVSRAEMYDWEIREEVVPVGDVDNDGDVDDDDAGADSTADGENGNPRNYGGSTAPSSERRTVSVAVINCIADGPINGASGGPFPVKAFAKMFLVKPVDDPSTAGMYAEVISKLDPGVDTDVLHDIVQLYR